jgi:hypothetical protein
MSVRLATIVFLLSSAQVRAADMYCAFEVTVHNPGGGPMGKVPVGIVQRGNIVSETETNGAGVARICDSPLDPVSFFIGFGRCGQVQIEQVKPTWLETKKLFVTYAKSSCDDFAFEKRCHFLVRIKNEQGQPIAGAALRDVPERSTEPRLSDALGRLFRTAEADQELKGTVIKDGYSPTPFSHSCNWRDGTDIETVIVLRKISGPPR